MKFTLPILLTILMLSFNSHAQDSKDNRSIFKDITVKEKITVAFDGKAYSMNALQNLKQELLKYDNKISSVIIHPTTQRMSITYNGFMQRYDFENAFMNHGISYYTTPPTTTSVGAESKD